MIQGLYSAAAGMYVHMDEQDTISNNLANVSTPGYKRKVTTFSSFDATLQTAAQNIDQGSAAASTPPPTLPSLVISEDQSTGSVQQTNVPTDIALDGPGSFVVQSGNATRLTRAGNFHLDGTGHLVTSDNSQVLGEKGPIQIPSGSEWSVDFDGTVRVGSNAIDKLKIDQPAGTKSQTRVLSGCLEGSNVNTVQEMVSMISAMRSYEACSKVIQNLDQTMDKAINQMSR